MPDHGLGSSSRALPTVVRSGPAVKAVVLFCLCVGGCGALRLEPADAREAAEADVAVLADARSRSSSEASEHVARGRKTGAAGDAAKPKASRREKDNTKTKTKKKKSFWEVLRGRTREETERMRAEDKRRMDEAAARAPPPPASARPKPKSGAPPKPKPKSGAPPKPQSGAKPGSKESAPPPKPKKKRRPTTSPLFWEEQVERAKPVVPALIPQQHHAAKSVAASRRIVPKGKCKFPKFGSTEYLEGVQVLPTNTNPISFEKFNHGSGNKEGLFVYPKSNISMCIIEKDGCTSWLTIWNKLTHDKLNLKSAWYGVVPFHWSATNATEVFSNPMSTRIVWVREPLERFLSGFLDKCANFHDFNYYHICGFHWNRTQSPGFPLSQAQAWFNAGHTLKELDSHFTPQAWHCELSTRLHEYNVIGLMSKANFSKDAGCVLERANLAYLNEEGGEAPGLPFFTDVQNQGELEDQNTEILKKFFTKEFALYLMDLYKEDYDLFRIKRPSWVNEATGDWFNMRTAAVRSTSLRQRAKVPGKDWEPERSTHGGEDLAALAARVGFYLPRHGKVSI